MEIDSMKLPVQTPQEWVTVMKTDGVLSQIPDRECLPCSPERSLCLTLSLLMPDISVTYLVYLATGD